MERISEVIEVAKSKGEKGTDELKSRLATTRRDHSRKR
jgi:hypothetical protein